MPQSEGNHSGCNTTSHPNQTDRLIECCLDNVTVDEHRELAASDTDVEMQYCLQQCGICYATPFLVVDGDVIQGVSHRALIDSLQEDSAHE
ncbi:DUF1450 domain-containing protein [Natronomonas sp. CBA1123]|uniref:DUF1450 domain-containing protein n=1 Tax=Natronomonas sp. CBA1123 TaxID=2668070 RepID=UPI0012EAED8F|nr:DUF1450 domain-containing protein [Natronomonas sp. CBA1123]